MAFEFAMQVMCDWCQKVTKEGDASKGVSHGICTKCAEAMIEELRK